MFVAMPRGCAIDKTDDEALRLSASLSHSNRGHSDAEHGLLQVSEHSASSVKAVDDHMRRIRERLQMEHRLEIVLGWERENRANKP